MSDSDAGEGVALSPADERYFGDIEAQLDEALAIAENAKEKGRDPSPDVEIPVAKDMADRVENLLGIEGVAARVRELEGEMGREEAALALARDFAEGRVGDYETRAGKVEGAVRTAVALLTEGVVAAPIEGIDGVEFVEDGNTELVRVYYAGPIRSAGGTAQALSVLVADYTRTLLGLDGYEPRSQEVERYAEEVELYDKTTGLQYSPKKKETRFIAQHCPVMLDGEATGEEEVSGYRDLERVATNKPRGGMCLVLAEGIAQKAPKIKRYTSQLDELDWPWLDDLIAGTIDEGADAIELEEDENAADTPEAAEGEASPEENADTDDASEASDAGGDDSNDGDRDEPRNAPRPEPSEKYLRDLIAGRPVFGHPSEPGGFRLRYGRARNHGFATAGVHPATMRLVDDFLATGTQIKTERPGKAAGVVPVDSIDGPTVRLANGDVRRIDDPEEALEVRNGVEAILDLGEYLVNYGEFLENNNPLAPASYTVEWWLQDFAAAGGDAQAIEDSARIDVADPGAQRAIEWAREYDAPLHPAYTYLWHDLSIERFETLREAVGAGELSDRLYIENTPEVRAALETLLVSHTQSVEREMGDGEGIENWISIPDDPALALRASLGFDVGGERDAGGKESIDTDALAADGGGLSAAARGHDDAMRAVAETAPFTIQERAPTRIGNRMGRPEKSEKRELSPAVHTLFPIGEAGGNQRDIAKATDHSAERGAKPGEISAQLGRRECRECGTETFRARCPEPGCAGWTEPVYECPDCEITVTPDENGSAECPRCGEAASSTAWQTIDLKGEYRNALQSVGERENAFPILKGVKGLTSTHKTPEPIEKGVLRAKHDVSTFKDGTVRYDMTDLPVTSVRPTELDVSVDRFRQLGYEEDVLGDPLRHDDQLVELEVQDVVLSDGAADHLLKTAAFVDDLLVNYYDEAPFYECDDREDLVGELVFGMAPHTSAAVVGRVVGFTSAAVGYAHPYFHAAKRRNCFDPETKLWYETEESWQYGTIAELVETHLDDPTEDDFGTLVEEPAETIRVPSLDSEGEPTRESIEAVSKHPAPEHLVEIETADGHRLTVTPDHTMLRRASGERSGIEEVRASEIAVGDRVPAYDGGETTTITGAVGAKNGGATVADGGDGDRSGDGGRNSPPLSEVTRVGVVESESEHVYCLTVPTHRVAVNGIYAAQCDGDEDCVMLLMDGLLNFSKSFLPDKRGGKMDAPLVMSSRIDPAEIDDEAHNMDVTESYSQEFYEATREMADPGKVDITIAEESVGTASQCSGFRHTHDTSNIALGPDLSAYKTLGSMLNKTNAQLELARKARAVDETDVAERIIEYHFLPDLIGNLRAFSRQETRCLGCGTKYRRVPLSGSCRECGGQVNLTVHEGSVKKYIETATTVAEEYDCRLYTKQRLEILERNIESIFEDDTNKQSGIADFM